MGSSTHHPSAEVDRVFLLTHPVNAIAIAKSSLYLRENLSYQGATAPRRLPTAS
ncbi:MAG: hypothetical protein WBF52_18875 [Geitlerinemataceae cyanobacterium]